MNVLKIIGVIVVGVAVVALFVSGGPQPEDALRAVHDEGYTNATVTDTSGWATHCGSDDSEEFTVQATNVQEKHVRLYVCCGYTKGCTIRH